ncbi:hypothetical protein J2788_002943 [Variovorax paradoxus]|nr:hypothetical protein [Variovorax paradoxus]MDR6453448.1 hypothetical protein [Variovorax paradoxus]
MSAMPKPSTTPCITSRDTKRASQRAEPLHAAIDQKTPVISAANASTAGMFCPATTAPARAAAPTAFIG